MSQLHDAVQQRRASQVEDLLRAGHDPNALDDSGAPPLRFVLTYGVGFVLEDDTERMIRALLAAGADPGVAGVGRVLVEEAGAMVCSAGEAANADRLARMLGVGT
jgi:hypothetical protein